MIFDSGLKPQWGTVMVMIVWWLDLQLPMQSVPITLMLCVWIPLMAEFVSDLRQVDGFLQFPPPIKLTDTMYPGNWNIVESGVQHHNPNPWFNTTCTCLVEKQPIANCNNLLFDWFWLETLYLPHFRRACYGITPLVNSPQNENLN